MYPEWKNAQPVNISYPRTVREPLTEIICPGQAE